MMDEQQEIDWDRAYDPEMLLNKMDDIYSRLQVLENELAETAGPAGCFCDDTPDPVMRKIDEAGDALTRAREAMRGVKFGVKRWKRVQETGEKF